MRVDNYSTRNFATLEPSELGLPFIGPSDSMRKHRYPIFRHWAGVRLYTLFFNVAKPCVFGKQLPIHFFFALFKKNYEKGLLFPKLRKKFAEFLCRDSVFA
jgi:hypothetical protein